MRVISAITLLFLSTLVPFPLTLLLFTAHAFFWCGFELLFIAAAVDVYFGHSSQYPVYLLATTIILLVLEWVKPRLLFYNEPNV